jgi:hypothetical protein
MKEKQGRGTRPTLKIGSDSIFWRCERGKVEQRRVLRAVCRALRKCRKTGEREKLRAVTSDE